MSKMFVANCTHQIQVFIYRLPESKRSFTQEIPIGGQVQVAGLGGGELSTKDIESIIRQHTKYGLVDVHEIDRRQPFFGTCFSLDKAIPVNKIMAALEHNRGILDARGREIMQHAAVGVSAKIDQEVPGLKGLEMEAMELDNTKTGHTGVFSDAVRIDPTAPPNAPPRAPARSARNRAA